MFPEKMGGGWYRLSNGEKVRGLEAAKAAEAKLSALSPLQHKVISIRERVGPKFELTRLWRMNFGAKKLDDIRQP